MTVACVSSSQALLLVHPFISQVLSVLTILGAKQDSFLETNPFVVILLGKVGHAYLPHLSTTF